MFAAQFKDEWDFSPIMVNYLQTMLTNHHITYKILRKEQIATEILLNIVE
jgi:hypothetical protein